MAKAMTKQEFMDRYRKDQEKKNRKKQRDIDGARAFMYKSSSGKNSRTCGNSTGIKSLYGGF